MDQTVDEEQQLHQRRFRRLGKVATAFGGAAAALVILWTTSYRGGFGWSTRPELQFNWHPVCMVLGLNLLSGMAGLVYRAARDSPKSTVKTCHAIMQATALLLAIIGLCAVFGFHNGTGKPNLYSLHSWTGLGTVILFAGQLLVGLVSFVWPGLRSRASILPIHMAMGCFMFVTSIVCTISGLTEKAIFSIKDYSQTSEEGLVVNSIGILIVIFAGIVLHLVSDPKYRRPPSAEESVLLEDR